eukprot:GHRQ01038365.1.p1 GENE.GHRQ01038365.1~~GHRQ01038365.1.p1  ORF type:complete len:159 (-),score=6.56 GHRQ01038365.1:246-722(-)
MDAESAEPWQMKPSSMHGSNYNPRALLYQLCLVYVGLGNQLFAHFQSACSMQRQICALTKLYGIFQCTEVAAVSQLDDQQPCILLHGPDPLVGQALRVYAQWPAATCTHHRQHNRVYAAGAFLGVSVTHVAGTYKVCSAASNSGNTAQCQQAVSISTA